MCAPIRIKRFPPFDEKVKRAVGRDWIDHFCAHADPHLAAFALFIHTTAARTGEAIKLRPCDLDLDAGVGWSRNPTKNGGRRQFWLTAEMLKELRSLPPRPIRGGRYSGELRVFGWNDVSGIARLWRATCEKANLNYVTPHEAGRHSFATEGITRQGRSVVMVAKIGNWRDTTTLLRNYAHPENLEMFVEEVYGGKTGAKLTRRKRRNSKTIRKST